MSGQPVIEAVNLTKSYGAFTAVNKLDLRVKEGEVYGFLGPNGAGKTTTILMALGLTEPTSGTIKVCGLNSTRDALKVKRMAGYLPENLGFYDDLTASENLRYVGRLNGLSETEIKSKVPLLLEQVGIPQVADKTVDTFSKGMKQRLGIAAVLIKNPKVVFLDEPTSGLDPEGANNVLNLITSMSRDQNITVMLSSHLLHQVQKICHKVAILSRGRLVAEGPVDSLERQTFGKGKMSVELELTSTPPELIGVLQRLDGVASVERSGDRLLLLCDRDVRANISRTVAQNGSALLQMKILGHGLEEIYLKYFQEGGA
ncbi:MAG: ABC transporter ATP-binding protein [Chloroflexi bacterium]|nr:ABC transporter ATP-binding protein [Chloroflexota bacterium]